MTPQDLEALDRVEKYFKLFLYLAYGVYFAGIYAVLWAVNKLCSPFFTFDVKYLTLVALIIWLAAENSWGRFHAIAERKGFVPEMPRGPFKTARREER